MKVIGITGGIGSGKSLITDILQDYYKALILNTDLIAKKQMEVGGESYQNVVEYFGTDILLQDGSIDRNKLAGIVFHDQEKLGILSSLTHPPVINEVQRIINDKREEENIPFVAIETALMIEAGLDYLCDEVWYIYSPENNRRERLKSTRNYTDEKIDAIFQRQSKEEDFRKKYSKVIDNSGDIESVKAQVEKLICSLNEEYPQRIS